jgi:hypothetical protein
MSFPRDIKGCMKDSILSLLSVGKGGLQSGLRPVGHDQALDTDNEWPTLMPPKTQLQ